MRMLSLTLLALILSLPMAAQSKKEAATKTAEAKEAKINWDGEWALVPDQSDQLDALINEHVKDLHFIKKPIWKKKLQNACKIWQALDILCNSESFSVTMGKERPADSTSDGTASAWKRSDDETFQVSLRKDGPRMTQIFQGDSYTLTHVYSMRTNGKTLALQVTYTHKDLPNPFSYKLVFKRNE